MITQEVNFFFKLTRKYLEVSRTGWKCPEMQKSILPVACFDDRLLNRTASAKTTTNRDYKTFIHSVPRNVSKGWNDISNFSSAYFILTIIHCLCCWNLTKAKIHVIPDQISVWNIKLLCGDTEILFLSIYLKYLYITSLKHTQIDQ